ncbi:hypothetical protein GCM10009610_31400 [Pseudonocardia xinjiangensis]
MVAAPRPAGLLPDGAEMRSPKSRESRCRDNSPPSNAALRGRIFRRARARKLIAIVTAASAVTSAALAILFWVVLTQTELSAAPPYSPPRDEIQIDNPSSATVVPGGAAPRSAPPSVPRADGPPPRS